MYWYSLFFSNLFIEVFLTCVKLMLIFAMSDINLKEFDYDLQVPFAID